MNRDVFQSTWRRLSPYLVVMFALALASPVIVEKAGLTRLPHDIAAASLMLLGLIGVWVWRSTYRSAGKEDGGKAVAEPPVAETVVRRGVKLGVIILALPVLALVAWIDFAIALLLTTFLIDVTTGLLPVSQISLQLSSTLLFGVAILAGTVFGGRAIHRRWTNIWSRK